MCINGRFSKIQSHMATVSKMVSSSFVYISNILDIMQVTNCFINLACVDTTRCHKRIDHVGLQ